MYFLKIGHHVHSITNFTDLIRNFTRNPLTEYCETCYRIYDRWYVTETGHARDDKDEEVCEDGKMCTIENRTFPYFPKIGLAQSLIPEFIERTQPKEKCTCKIIYLDFETTVVGYSHFERDGHCVVEIPIPPQNLPISPFDRYEPYPFIPKR